ncbi:hypothetical protein KAH81_10250 [bacterium]|nr:hypothetical protein [bacterium]
MQIVPTSGAVSVRCCTAVSLERDSATNNTRLLLLDPPSTGSGNGRSLSGGRRAESRRAETNVVRANLSRDRILAAARARAYREKLFGDITTMFRYKNKSLELVRKPFVPSKTHGWLDIA